MRVHIKQTGLEYDGFIRIESADLAFEKFSGEMSGAVRRFRYHRGDVAAVMIYDAGRDRVLLIRQFRYAVHARTGEGWVTECVAGIQEKGESIEAVARREVREETGLKLAELELLAEYYFSPGGCSDKVHLFLGTLVDPEQSLGVYGVPQEDEDIQACWVSLSQALEMARSGQIQDAKTLIGLHMLENRLLRRAVQDSPA
ncbi:MAG: NUDIX hydrolase [Acidobacteriota bacterium]|nr:NUDIX hydrolase [Acidobacteriota bacterium]MDE2962678.1 NUDIX hydrolase [Acidobacteriota bacterium]